MAAHLKLMQIIGILLASIGLVIVVVSYVLLPEVKVDSGTWHREVFIVEPGAA